MPKGGSGVKNYRQYWATMALPELGRELMDRIEQYYTYLNASGRLFLLRRSYQYYYRPGLIGAKINQIGTEGEIVTIGVNHYRNLLKHLHTLTCSEPPAWEPKATNTDQKSQEQCILARGLLDYYLSEKKLERVFKQAVEYALVLAEGFVFTRWNATSGEEFGANPETGAIIYQGDLEYEVYSPLDLIRDMNLDSPARQQWNITRNWVNRWDLIAKYPEYADDLMKIREADWDNLTWKDTRLFLFEKYNTEMIPYYTMLHKKTDSLPNGRMTTFVNKDIIFDDGPIPYRDIQVRRICCAEWQGTPFGYTTGYDLLPLQQMLDSLYSTVCTNQAAFGVQNIWCQKGDAPDVSDLSGGLKLVLSDKKPEPLQLTSTAPETLTFIQNLERLMETLSGVNAVSRGNPQEALGSNASGAAMALIQSMAIQFSQDLQSSYAQLVGDVGTDTINTLRDYATVPRIAAITGKSNRQYLKEFTGDDLSEVNRVTVDMGNPVMRTKAGQVNMADQLLQSGKLQDANQYIEVYTTGKLEPLYEGQQSELMLIRGENEKLSTGQSSPVIISDLHHIHIQEHSPILASPEARMNPQLVQVALQHLQDHLDKWRAMDPGLAQLRGIPPAPPPPAQPLIMEGVNLPGMQPPSGAIPGGPQLPSPSAPPPGSSPPDAQGMSPPAQMLNPANPVMKKAAQIRPSGMPNPPKGTPQANAQIINQMQGP